LLAGARRSPMIPGTKGGRLWRGYWLERRD
jgi:hypothetical protein